MRAVSMRSAPQTIAMSMTPQNGAAGSQSGGFRHIYIVSDIHTDYESNLQWARQVRDNAAVSR